MPQFYQQETIDRLHRIELEIVKDFTKICDSHGLTYFGYAGTGIGALRHRGFIPWDDDIDVSMPRKDYEKFLKIVRHEMSDKYFILNSDVDYNCPFAITRLCLKGTEFRDEPFRNLECECGIFLDIYPLDNAADLDLDYWIQMWSAWFWGKVLYLRDIERPYLYFGGPAAKIVSDGCAAVHRILKACNVSKKWLIDKRDYASQKYNGKKTKRMAYFCDPLPYVNTFSRKDIYPLRRLPFEDTTMLFPHRLEALLTKMYGDYMTPPPKKKRKTHYPYRLDFGPYGADRQPQKKTTDPASVHDAC